MRVLVFGATSYVGAAFVSECLRRGWEVVAWVRDPVRWKILGLPDSPSLRLTFREDDSLEKVDVAVNFAYVKSERWYLVHRETRNLIERFLSVACAASASVALQVSSQAVFGYRFSAPPTPGPVALQLGDAYIEGKIIGEQVLLRRACNAGLVPVVLRLGNVVGPGAVPWIATLASHVLLGKPVGRGKSNATYIGNAIDYLCHVVSVPSERLIQFGPFHHLAEFSKVSWDAFVERMCATMGVRPRYTERALQAAGLEGKMMKRLLGIARYVAGALPASYAPYLDRVSAMLKPYLSTISSTNTADGAGLAEIMNEQYEFESHTLPGWVAPFDLETVLETITSWLENTGYRATR